MSVSTFDPRDPAAMDDPLPILLRLQDADPVHWSPALRGWVITRHEDIKALLRDDQLSADRLVPFYDSLPADERNAVAGVVRHLNTWVSFKDPPEHTHLKACLSATLTTRDVQSLRPYIQAAAVELVERIGTQAQFDFIAEFARPLPAMVIAHMCDLPRDAMDQIRYWSGEMRPFIGSASASPDKYARADAAARAMGAYFQDVVRERRRTGGEDLIARLIARGTSSQLSEEEIVGACVLLVFAGHETTTNLIGNGMRVLLQFPRALRVIQQQPIAVKSAVEEILRFDGPTGGLVRVARADCQVRGKHIARGQRVFLMVHAANHDPRVFRNPDVFDIERAPNPHLAFNYGAHFCLGASLARLEGQIALREVARRLPTLRLDGPVRYMDTLVMRGVGEMPCTLE
jgi:cytochrome P450